MNDLADQLRREHEQLEQLLVRLAEDSDSRDPRELQETWSAFERSLTSHLRTEERQLLPRFVASHPDEVRSVLAQHRLIREQVAELGVRVDLHAARKNALLLLIRTLRDHARAEERTLYGWVETGLPEREARR